jgi:hypothetical protein
MTNPTPKSPARPDDAPRRTLAEILRDEFGYDLYADRPVPYSVVPADERREPGRARCRLVSAVAG